MGFITPLTNHFCLSCNRLRMTSDGHLRTCLFADREYPLRPLLRHPKVTDEHIARVIAQACKSKPVGADLLAARQGALWPAARWSPSAARAGRSCRTAKVPCGVGWQAQQALPYILIQNDTVASPVPGQPCLCPCPGKAARSLPAWLPYGAPHRPGGAASRIPPASSGQGASCPRGEQGPGQRLHGMTALRDCSPGPGGETGNRGEESVMWQVYALLAAVFAALTAIFPNWASGTWIPGWPRPSGWASSCSSPGA